MTSRIHKGIRGSDEEKIASQQLAGFDQSLLGLFKVEINVQRFDEICDRIIVFIVLLLDDPNQVLEMLLILSGIPTSAPVSDDRRRQVAQDPGTARLNRVDVGL